MKEHTFPTIEDAAEVLAELASLGLGSLPVQIILVPDSTIQAVARTYGDDCTKPALMIELGGKDGRMPVGMISAERVVGGRGGMPSLRSN